MPNSVFSPVANTTARPVPEATLVPMNTRFGMLMVASSSSMMGSAVLRTESDSPVRAMLLVESSYCRTRRASALMLSPSSSTMTSPGTRSAAATMVTSPSRMTLAFDGTSFCSASVAFSARYSWKKPMVALSRTTREDRDRDVDVVLPAGARGEHGGDEDEDRRHLKHDGEQAGELVEELVDDRPTDLGRQHVLAVLGQPSERLILGEPLGRRAQRLVDVVVGQGPDISRYWFSHVSGGTPACCWFVLAAASRRGLPTIVDAALSSGR